MIIFFCFLPDFRVACLNENFSKLCDFTNKVYLNKTDEIVRKCAYWAELNNDTLYALGRGGVCLSGKNITVKYHANDTKNATCNQGIGMEDSIFVYSLGKYICLFFRSNLNCFYGSRQVMLFYGNLWYLNIIHELSFNCHEVSCCSTAISPLFLCEP